MSDATLPADACPRCGNAFHCGAHDNTPCACTTVRLDAATLAALRERYDGCLCVACLAQLATAPSVASTDSASDAVR